MKRNEERNTAHSAETAADFSKFMKSQSLRLDKQAIRTLTGAELRLVGGGIGGESTDDKHKDWVQLAAVPWRPIL